MILFFHVFSDARAITAICSGRNLDGSCFVPIFILNSFDVKKIYSYEKNRCHKFDRAPVRSFLWL